MSRFFRIHTVTMVASALVAGQSLTAQAQSSPPARAHTTAMSTMANCPMMAAMMRGPDAVLSKRSALGLTDAQVQQLETLRTTEMQAMRQPMDSMMAIHKQLATLSETPQFDESSVRRVFDRMGALHTNAGTAMLRARHDAAAVLTPQQRKKLEDATGTAGSMGAMGMMNMSGMNMSGTAGKGMMQGGMGNMKSMESMMSMMGMPGCAMMHDSTAAGMHK